ncbi:MAG: NAD(P)-dependent oxidoreductase, partial [Pseudomonadota bacterium]
GAASLRLFRAFGAVGGARAVFAGSCAEYDWNCERLRENATPLAPHTLYGRAKVALSSLVLSAAGAMGISVAWGRIFFPYGPEESGKRLIGGLCDAMLRNEVFAMSSGRQERDFIHVRDVAAAFVRLLSSAVEGPVNIASGQTSSVRDVALKIQALGKREDLLAFGRRSEQDGEPERMIASTARLRDEVNFRPRFDLASGLEDTYRRRLAAQQNDGNVQ